MKRFQRRANVYTSVLRDELLLPNEKFEESYGCGQFPQGLGVINSTKMHGNELNRERGLLDTLRIRSKIGKMTELFHQWGREMVLN
jgi:hypothetical protein